MIKFIFLLTIFLISIASFSFIITQPLIFLILIPLIGVFIILFTDLSKINKINTKNIEVNTDIIANASQNINIISTQHSPILRGESVEGSQN